MIKSFANLVKDENSFEKSFRDSVIFDHDMKKNYRSNRPQNRIDELIEASRVFVIGQKEYLYDELENIFFMDKPISQREYKNTPQCNTCQNPWKKQTELQNSHCHFCGKSSCKDCFKKTRMFRAKKDVANEERPRGRICKLCDRKFIIKDMI